MLLVYKQPPRIKEKQIKENVILPYKIFLNKNYNNKIDDVLGIDENGIINRLCYTQDIQNDLQIINVLETDFFVLLETNNNNINRIFKHPIKKGYFLNHKYYTNVFRTLPHFHISNIKTLKYIADNNIIVANEDNIVLNSNTTYIITDGDNNVLLAIYARDDVVLNKNDIIYPYIAQNNDRFEKYVIKKNINSDKVLFLLELMFSLVLEESIVFLNIQRTYDSLTNYSNSIFYISNNPSFNSLAIPIYYYSQPNINKEYVIGYDRNLNITDKNVILPVNIYYGNKSNNYYIEENIFKKTDEEYFYNINESNNVFPFDWNFYEDNLNKDIFLDVFVYKCGNAMSKITLNLLLERDLDNNEVKYLNNIAYYNGDSLYDAVMQMVRDNNYPLIILTNDNVDIDKLYADILRLRNEQSIYSLVFISSINAKYRNNNNVFKSDIILSPKGIITFNIIQTLNYDYIPYAIINDKTVLLKLKNANISEKTYFAINYNSNIVLLKPITYVINTNNLQIVLCEIQETENNVSAFFSEYEVIVLQEIIKYDTNYTLFYKEIQEKTLLEYINEIRKISDDYIVFNEGIYKLAGFEYGRENNEIKEEIENGYKFSEYRISALLNYLKTKNKNELYNYDAKIVSLLDENEIQILRNNNIDAMGITQNYPIITSNGKNGVVMFLICYLSYLERKMFNEAIRKNIINEKIANNIMNNIKKIMREYNVELNWKIEIVNNSIIIYNNVNVIGEKIEGISNKIVIRIL